MLKKQQKTAFPSLSTYYWCSLLLNIVCHSGLHNIRKVFKVHESIQRKATVLFKELEDICYQERLRMLGLHVAGGLEIHDP